MTRRKLKSSLKKYISLILSLILLLGHISLFAGAEAESSPKVPEYVHRLSKLIRSTLNENDFGVIELKIDEPEMVIDGQERPISADENLTPVIENGELAIPEAVIDAVSDTPAVQVNGAADDINRKITEPELEALGYDVKYNEETGTILITEPFQLMRLLVKTETGRVSRTYGAIETINISNNITVLQYDSKEKTKSAYERFNNDAEVLICAQDQIVNIADCEPGEAQTVAVQGENEQPYKNWGTVRVGADQYMAKLPDADQLEEVVVAVIDTGVDLDHPFFEGRIKEGGYDFFDDDDDPDDEHFHGTHCAGIVRDATKENVKILPIKIGNANADLTVSMLPEAIKYAVDSGADILSMSFGFTVLDVSWTQLVCDTIKYVDDNGALSVAGAGNYGVDLTKLAVPLLPASCPQTITVTSCNEQNGFSYFSDYGDAVDLCAPGENVLSAVPGGGFERYSGTSMATPLVAAAAALVKSDHPEMTNDAVKAWLYNNAVDMGTPGWDMYYGNGILFAGDDFSDFHLPLESLSFNEENIELEWGEYKELALEYQPHVPTDYLETVFTTSDENIVYLKEIQGVSSRVFIVGLSEGTAVITATYTNNEGVSVSTSVTVNVKPYKEIISMGNGYFIMDDHTVNNLVGSGYGLKPIRGEDGGLFTGAEKYTRYYLLKTDGTLWVNRLKPQRGSDIEELKYPVQVKDQDDAPLSDIVDVAGLTALRSDGTVWVRQMVERTVNGHTHYEYDGYVFTPLLKEDGTPLTGVKKITSNTAVTEEGYAYYFNGLYNYAEVINYDDGNPFPDIAEAYYYYYYDDPNTRSYTVVLRNDGTVWVKGDNTNNLLGTPEINLYSKGFIRAKISPNQYLTNVKQLSFEDTGFNGENYTTYALCNDGSLWAWGGIYDTTEMSGVEINRSGFLGIGEYDNSKIYVSRVKTDENTFLENVAEILCSGICSMRCMLKDGTVWQTGRINSFDYETKTYTENIYYAQPMKYLGKTIRLTGDIHALEPELILPEDSGMVIDENRGSIYGITAGMKVDDFEALFDVSWDGYVEIAAPGRYVGTGSLLIVHDSHGEVLAEYTLVVFGDLDGNGRVTSADVAIANQALVDGFEDEIFEFAANVVKTTKRNKFNAADVAALYSALIDEPIDQAAMAQVYAYNGW